MAKTVFSKGDCVVGKKWSGAEIVGVYEYSYDDGSHCVLEVSTNKRFCIKPKDLQLLNDEEAKEVKKLMKEKKIKLHEKADVVSSTKNLSTVEEKKKEELDVALAGDDEEESTETNSIDVEGTELD